MFITISVILLLVGLRLVFLPIKLFGFCMRWFGLILTVAGAAAAYAVLTGTVTLPLSVIR